MRSDAVRFMVLLIAVAAVIWAGCSGSASSLMTPDGTTEATHGKAAAVSGSHNFWGMWQFTADPAEGRLDVAQLRMGDFHLNAIVFLEPPALVNLTLESVEFNGNIVEADIGLRHPFLGLDEFTGFDVCGVLITNGSVTGYADGDIVMAGDGDTRLLNPDGWTRWWNPAEFPIGNTMSNYKDGLLGTPNAIGNYNSTLNAYKLFCNELTDPDAPVGDVAITSRCVFSAGQKNVRHYSIELGSDGLVFNYAIDANWQFPNGSPPWSVPDDFGPSANRQEAWNVSVTEDENTLWNDSATGSGGDLSLIIDVWDHYNAALNSVKVESPGNFDGVTSATPTGGGEGYSTYEIDITDATPAAGWIELFITVESEGTGYQGLLPVKKVAAYFKHTSEVSDEPPQQVVCGEGVYTSFTQTPFQDQSIDVQKNEIQTLISGPYAGQMIVESEPGKIRRYDMNTIAPHTGNAFLSVPPGAYGSYGLIYHIDVEPVTGRVIVVPEGLGNNNSLLIYDNAGNLLSPDTGISVGANRKIYAVHPNENGDIWLLTTYYTGFTSSNNSRLERWAYQSGAPYYQYDPTCDLATDQIIGHQYGSNWVVENDITEMTISWHAQRIYIFQQAQIGEHNGKLYLFDINTSGPPTARPDLHNLSVFSQGTWRSFYDNQRGSNGGLVCDHSDPDIDYCRIMIFGRSHPDFGEMLAHVDMDGKVVNEIKLANIPGEPMTIGINANPELGKQNIVYVDYFLPNCFMDPPPADW